jgi:hypothetical protein
MFCVNCFHHWKSLSFGHFCEKCGCEFSEITTNPTPHYDSPGPSKRTRNFTIQDWKEEAERMYQNQRRYLELLDERDAREKKK